jgi:hypothetical protein
MKKSCTTIFGFLVGITFSGISEPIVITGAMVPSFIGTPINRLRLVDHRGTPIPFQIDEVTVDDEYVCPLGKEPNAGNGLLDSADEIVFLWKDADSTNVKEASGFADSGHDIPGEWIAIGHATGKRFVRLVDNPSVPLSETRYVRYDEKNETVSTPFYYAAFGRNRFHFIKAGVRDFTTGAYVDLTSELRVQLYFRALWGLLPISYSEDKMVCFVKRYKTGPIRLIRRGDFHLNMGLWIQGSHAAVNQLCYSDMVRVTVYITLPFHFRSLFSQAYIEMTPVIKKGGERFSFKASHGIVFPFDRNRWVDSLVPANPNHELMTVDDGATGYGWLLDANMGDRYLNGSGYVFRAPSLRSGLCDCGFRLSVRELPKGNYLIANWVLFSGGGASAFELKDAADKITRRAEITFQHSARPRYNQLTAIRQFKKR